MHSFAVSEEPVQGHQGHQGHRQTRHCSWRKLTESSQSQVISMVTAGIMAGCSITRHKCHNTLDNIWLDLTTLPRCWWTRSQGSRALKLTAFIIRIIYINLTDLTVYFIYFMTLWYLAFSLLVFATAFVQVLAGLQALTHAHARPCLTMLGPEPNEPFLQSLQSENMHKSQRLTMATSCPRQPRVWCTIHSYAMYAT